MTQDRGAADGEGLLEPTERHGASFSLANKAQRVAWQLAWLILCRWTPPALHRWRAAVLRLFGARVGAGARVYASVRIWLPANLSLGERALIGPRVRLYNQGLITIGHDAVVSQDASLCASTHDADDPLFPLQLRQVTLGAWSWIAAEAFVGPGVAVGEGTVLGARGVAMRDLAEWSVYSGNPATRLKDRPHLAH